MSTPMTETTISYRSPLIIHEHTFALCELLTPEREANQALGSNFGVTNVTRPVERPREHKRDQQAREASGAVPPRP